MSYTKEQYESLINESSLFIIDKEADSALYKSLKYEFVTLLTEYYMTYVYKSKPMEDYSMELIDSASECIKHYDTSKGTPFLHYFNKVLSKNLMISKAKLIQDEYRQGITMSKNDGKMIRIILSFANSKHIDVWNIDAQNHIAEFLGISTDKVVELMLLNENAVAVQSTVSNEDGDEIEIYDLQPSNDLTPEEKAEQIDSVRTWAIRIDTAYKKLQNRPTMKKLLAMILTAKFIEALEQASLIKNVLSNLEFVDESIINEYINCGNIPTAREIAALCGVTENSASRTIKNFLVNLKNNC